MRGEALPEDRRRLDEGVSMGLPGLEKSSGATLIRPIDPKTRDTNRYLGDADRRREATCRRRVRAAPRAGGSRTVKAAAGGAENVSVMRLSFVS